LGTNKRGMERAARANEAELIETQRLLRAAGAMERNTPRNVASAAMRRLQVRQKAIGHANEIVAALTAVVRGIGVLLASGEKHHDSRG
jgi:hypothetical protein